jgi:hypothetical protein
MSFTVSVDGRTVTAAPGQTVAALLIALGRDSWHTTRRDGRPRGVFCGIGVCFDCLVVVNGIPDIRACQRALAPGDVIRAQHGTQLPNPPIDGPPRSDTGRAGSAGAGRSDGGR